MKTTRITQSNPRARCDVRVENHGSIVLLRPITVTGQDWLDTNIPDDAPTWGNAVVAEPRYVPFILEGMKNDGLVVA